MNTHHPKPLIRVAFTDFLESTLRNNILVRALEHHYHVEIVKEQPDVLFYSCFGLKHLLYKNCIRVFYTHENVAPDFNICDFAISSCRTKFGTRHLYLPCSIRISFDEKLPPLPTLDSGMAQRRFCSFIYSNSSQGKGAQLRDDFCRKLMEYTHVDCPGRVLHNMDAPELSQRYDHDNWHMSKVKFLGKYKFNIAFENSDTDGYITEKLTDAFLGNTVPIYWGSEGKVAPFPREAMIIAHDYETLDDLVMRVREVNENDELYMRMLAANPLRHGMEFNPEKLLASFLTNCLKHKPFDKDPHHYATVTQIIQCIARYIKPLSKIAYLASLMAFGKTKENLKRIHSVLREFHHL